MNKEQTERLKSSLLKEKGKIESELKNLEKVPSFGEDSTDVEKEADEAEEAANVYALRNEFSSRLKKILKALEKMTLSAYGRCEKCGKEITPEVLEVVPESELCKNCKEIGLI